MADFTTRAWIPDPSQALAASVRVSDSVAQTNVLTIPAGRTWFGTVSIISSSRSATAVLGDTQAKVAGTNAIPAVGTVIGMASCDRDTASTVVTVPNVVVTAPAGNAVTIDLINSTATTHSGTVSCYGYLV